MRCGGRLRLLALLWLRERTKASYVYNDFPDIGILHLMRIAPGGHSSKFHTVLDNVMNFAVSEILRFFGAKIGHARIKRLADGREAAGVVTVAVLAMS